MKDKIIFLALLAVCFSCINVCAADVTVKDMLEIADKAYNAKDYNKSVVCYYTIIDSLKENKNQDADVLSYVRYRLGRAQIMQGKPERALFNMKDFYQKHPDDPFVVRDYARALYYNKQYRESVPVFEKAADLDKKFEPEAFYYIGSAKLATGDIEGGRKDLTKVKETYPQSFNAKSAERILAKLDKTLQEVSGMQKQAAVTAAAGRPTKEKPWAVSLAMGMEYDSNVGLIPTEQTRPSDISSTGDWRAVYSLSGIYEFLNTGGSLMGITGSIYGTKQFKDSDFNLGSGNLSLYYKKNIADIFQFRISPFMSKTFLDVSSHNWSYGVTPGVSYQPVSWAWTDLDYTYTRVSFADAPQYPQENRDGKYQNTVLRQNFNFNSLLLSRRSTYFAGWVFYGKADTDGSSYDYNNSKGFGVQVQQEFPANFTALLSYTYGRIKYDYANIRSTTNERRDDKSQMFSLNIFKKLDTIYKNLSAYAGWRWYDNNSNISQYYSYCSNTYSAGLVFDF